jgi:hypothetical protein
VTSRNTITVAQVKRCDQSIAQLNALAQELGILAKKAPDAPINKFKVGIVNERLREANELLIGEHKPFADFAQFVDTEMVSASDVVLVVSQYITSLEGWRSAHVVYDNYTWYWNTGDKTLRADPPTRVHKDRDGADDE